MVVTWWNQYRFFPSFLISFSFSIQWCSFKKRSFVVRKNVNDLKEYLNWSMSCLATFAMVSWCVFFLFTLHWAPLKALPYIIINSPQILHSHVHSPQTKTKHNRMFTIQHNGRFTAATHQYQANVKLDYDLTQLHRIHVYITNDTEPRPTVRKMCDTID